MAERYQDRPFPADDGYDRGGDPYTQPARAESDPLAELARLIGQTDPFAMGRANQPVQSHGAEREPYQPQLPMEDEPAPSPPPWMRRANPQPIPQAAPEDDYAPDYPSPVHPLHRYATAVAAQDPQYHQQPAYADAGHEADPSRYDDALYGELDPALQPAQHDPAYADDAYAYQDYGDVAEEEPPRKRGLLTVVMVLALAVVGTGAAFAYRTYVGSSRSGEPPIIKADNSPTKIVPAGSEGSAKVPDRMATKDGAEKIVPREEAPVDVNRSGPRQVFPPLIANNNPPPVSSVTPSGPVPPGAGNGLLPSNEPRKIKTLAVRGDPADAATAPVGAPPAAKPAPAPRAAAPAALAPPPGAPQAAPATRSPPASANASANAPLSLAPAPGAPAASEPRRVATVAPSGSILVSVSSQPSESAAQSSYQVLQGKYPTVLGSRSATIRRAQVGEKTVYRAMVGPFASSAEAQQFCSSLTAAGGQCFIPRN